MITSSSKSRNLLSPSLIFSSFRLISSANSTSPVDGTPCFRARDLISANLTSTSSNLVSSELILLAILASACSLSFNSTIARSIASKTEGIFIETLSKERCTLLKMTLAPFSPERYSMLLFINSIFFSASVNELRNSTNSSSSPSFIDNTTNSFKENSRNSCSSMLCLSSNLAVSNLFLQFSQYKNFSLTAFSNAEWFANKSRNCL